MVAGHFNFSFLMLISLMTLLILARHNCCGSLSPTIHSTPTNAIFQSDSCYSDLERESRLHALSKKVAIVANIPIFEFSKEVTQILTMAESENGLVDPSTIIELELIFYDYLAKLRSYYFLVFINYRQITISNGIVPSRLDLAEERDRCLAECRKAMQTALPVTLSTSSWSFQGSLLELESDIETLIDDAMSNLPTDEEENEISGKSTKIKRRSLLSRKVWKRFRWVAVQSILLMFNFAQTEWNRRSSKHLADRRLAEVPEFPLL